MSPNARAMIAAAKRDLPSPDLEDAILETLGVSVTAAIAPSLALKLWTAIKHAAVSKVSIGVVALGTAASGGYVAGRMQERALHEPPQLAHVETTTTTTPTPIAAHVVASPPIAPATIAAVAVSIESLPESPPITPVTITAPIPTTIFTVDESAPPPPPHIEHASLSEEVDAIRRARTNLLAGSAKAALTELDAYEVAHPNGALEEESLALRVRADRLAGDDAAASRALADLRTRFPSSVHLRALTK